MAMVRAMAKSITRRLSLVAASMALDVRASILASTCSLTSLRLESIVRLASGSGSTRF